MGMQITDVRVRRIEKEGKMKATVSITLDNEFVVHDIKVIEGEKGLFIAMLSQRLRMENFDIAQRLTGTRDWIQNVILVNTRRQLWNWQSWRKQNKKQEKKVKRENMKMSPDAGQSAPGYLLCRYSMLKNGRNLPECVQIIHKGVIMSGTIFSLIPPIVAIALALITKEVYLSLLIGIMSGAFLFTGPNPLHAVETMIAIMGEKIGGNVNILLFLAFLGIVVALITKSGASKAYGEWASHAIRTKKGALFATMFLGMLIFVDDYFNCLTVGTVMRPVTDKHKITRAKLAYIIDATAAPICIIAPISSWAAAVGSSLPEDSGVDGFSLFLHTIPFNLYALLTICFMPFLVAGDFDFAAMKRYEEQAKKTGKETTVEAEAMEISGNGKVIDLILPILVLIAFCVSGMLYTGGILDGVGLVEVRQTVTRSTEAWCLAPSSHWCLSLYFT